MFWHRRPLLDIELPDVVGKGLRSILHKQRAMGVWMKNADLMKG